MTSEVLIMTPNAIAMAADSVVTINNKKTYDGVNKLFMLSNNPPMGIMIYNNSNFFNIPLETIIKEFRRNIKEDNLEDIDDFKDAFHDFLKKICLKKISVDTISLIDQLNNFISQINFELTFKIKSIHQYRDETININNKKFEKLLFKNDTFRKNYLSKIKGLADELDLDEPDIEIVLKKLFIKRAICDNFIGIVIAGFNINSLLPSSLNFKIILLENKDFIFDEIEKEDLSNNPAIIKPFAQTNSIANFLNGIDFSTQFHFLKYFIKIANDYTSNLKMLVEANGKLRDKKTEDINKDIQKIENETRHIIKDYINFSNSFIEKNKNDTVKFVQALPKSELSNLAESLINITSLKVKVKNNVETVGGDVDVAIITKGDGFIWTQRKHYFEKSLNPQFFNRENFK